MKLTNEQQNILNITKNGEQILKIVAFAGTGKTTLLYEIAKQNRGRKLYLAFNKAIANEAFNKFKGTNTYVKTTHSLAYTYVIHRYGYKLKQNYSTMEISQIYNVDYNTAYNAKIIFENFCNSASSGFNDENMSEEKKLAKTLFEDMLNKKLDVTHSFYLKKFQLDLLNQAITFNEYDIILLDEAQDTNDVTLSIFYNLPAIQKIIVGDRHQQIYSFRGSINAINKIKAKIAFLTHSFRFNDKIAFKATNFLQIFKNEKANLKGLADNKEIKTKAIISRTNAELILQMKYLIENKKDFITIRDPSSIFGLALNLNKLENKDNLDKEFNYLKSFEREFKHLSKRKKETYEFDILNYIEEIANEDIELLSAVKIAQINNLEEIYKKAKEYYNNSKETIFLTTAHTAKGLEFDEVTICSDFPIYESIAKWFIDNNVIKIVKNKYLQYFVENCKIQQNIDELNLYYVAITRAKVKLNDKTDLNYLTPEIANQKIEEKIKEYLLKK